MLKFYESIETLKSFLKENTRAFKVIINTDTTLSIRLVCDDQQILSVLPKHSDVKIYIEEVYTEDEYNNDEFLRDSLNNEIDWTYKKRFNSFDYKRKLDFNIPIISFYSYKGGVGRTTSLITFATYYSNIEEKNIVILDFDFEAPGIINFFDIDFKENPKNGVVEYILDAQSSIEELNFKNYYIEVSKKYSGKGNMYVLPAGNIFDLENTKSYLEGLSRIDINTAESILKKLEQLLNKIKQELNPDIILIDSRTGFNDIFGLLSYSLSDTVIGFFTNNKQTAPGLEIFLEMMKHDYSPNFIIINSQIHFDRGYKKRFEIFQKKIENIFHATLENTTYMERIPVLIDLGTEDEDSDEFLDFIRTKYKLTNYQYFFNLITDLIEDSTKKPYAECRANESNLCSEISVLKHSLLTNVLNNYPKLYAEDTNDIHPPFSKDFIKNNFYIRTCMEDIFNFDKFLLIGGKGSGKTAFYIALMDQDFVNHLQRKANKTQKKYLFTEIISLKTDKQKNKYFPINLLKDFQHKDYRFYKRFWQVYILNSLALNGIKNYTFDFQPIELNDKQTSKIEDFFLKYIEDSFDKIENEFIQLDHYLKKYDINLIMTFDQLDFIVQPNFWNTAIIPLIDFSKNNSYFKIYSKLFIRRDLFEKLTNYTNKESLRDTNSINLEWSKDEIFGFFFKIIFTYAKEEFFQIMEQYSNNKFINSIKQEIEKKFNQIPLERYYLDPLIETFFGKYAYDGHIQFKRQKFGYIYDWFYKNLKNSDNTISLRPFLDMIKEAIKRHLESDDFALNINPILPAKFHTNTDVRKIAVEKHFNDLASEAGNEDLKTIIEHIRNTASTFPKKFRKRVLEGQVYEEFLEYLFQTLSLEITNVNDIEEILKINGIIKIDFIKSNYKKVEFAFLYKYYLGLAG